MTDPGNGGFQVHVSRAVAVRLRRLQRRAVARGEGKAFALAFKRIVQALHKNPNSTGELLYRLPKLRLEIRAVVVAPLAIHFALSKENLYVFIKSGALLSARKPGK